MDGFYRGVETSLLAITLALTVAALAILPSGHLTAGGIETTLPTISVAADDADG